MALIIKENKKNKKIFVVGGPHGHLLHLSSIIGSIKNYHSYDKTKDKVILLGNYTDYGPMPRQTIAYVRTLKEFFPNCTVLLGSRDYLMFKSNKGYFESEPAGSTLRSYIKNKSFDTLSFIKDRQFLGSLPIFYESDKFFFVASGLDPKKDLLNQSKGACMFIKERFTKSSRIWEKVIVHGNNPVKKVKVSKNRINVDTNCHKSNVLSCAVLDDVTGKLEHVFVS